MLHLSKRLLPYLLAVWVALAIVAPVQAANPAGQFVATFIQTRTLPHFDQPIVSHGKLRFGPETGLHWEIDQPYHYVFTLRDGTAHEQLPDGTRRTLTPDESPWLRIVGQIFHAALSGDNKALKQHFKIATQALTDGRRLTLTPRDDTLAKVISRIEVTESSPGHPRKLVVDEASGASMSVRFTPEDTTAGSP